MTILSTRGLAAKKRPFCRRASCWRHAATSILLLAPLVLTGQPVNAEEPKRLAFVVGIDEYDNLAADQRKLTRPVQDAVDVAKGFEGLGFTVVSGVGKNLTRDEFMAKWRHFVDEVKPGRNDTVVVFVSGHGMETENGNFLMTRNVPFTKFGWQSELERESISLSLMLRELETREPRLVLAIVDACRTNPFIPAEYRPPTSRGGSHVRDGMLVVFSAGGNQIALDRIPAIPPDTNPNSVFTRALLPLIRELKDSRTPLYFAWTQKLRKKVQEIADQARHKQSPRAYSGLLEPEVCLLGDCVTEFQITAFDPRVFSSTAACDSYASIMTAENNREVLRHISKVRTLEPECARYASARLSTILQSRSTLRIIAIGVDQFANSRFPSLQFSASDSRAVMEGVSSTMGGSYRDVISYILSDREGTKSKILSVLKEVQETAKPNDTLVVYFSGLGIEFGGRPYFVPTDGRATDPATFVDFTDLQRAMSRSFGQRILLLDTTLTESAKTVLLDDNRDDQVTVLAAASPGQMAMESAELGHGLFTHALLKGLAGEAFQSGHTEMTVADLARSVSLQVRELAARYGSKQVPYLITDEPNFVLTRKKSK